MGETMLNLVAGYLQALAHPTRIQILELLREEEQCVCQIFPAVDKEQSNVSRHLAILKNAGILGSRKEGVRVLYWVKDPRVFQLLDLVKGIISDQLREKAEILKTL